MVLKDDKFIFQKRVNSIIPEGLLRAFQTSLENF